MVRRHIISLAILTAMGTPAVAGGGGGERSGGANRIEAGFTLQTDSERQAAEAAAEFGAPEDGLFVDLPVVVSPVVDVDGRLVTYAFVTPRLRIREGVDVWRVRERSHILLDGFVRAVHATPLERAGRSGFNAEAARAAWLAAARETVERSDWVEAVEALGGDMRLLRR